MSYIVNEGARAPEARAPLRPKCLYPALALFVIGAHVAYFASGIYWPPPEFSPIASIDAELLPEGDTLDVGALAPEGESLDGADAAKGAEEPEESKEPEAPALPPTDAKEATEKAKPAKQEFAEKPKPKDKKAEKKKNEPRGAPDAGLARAGRRDQRYGLAGGAGQSEGSARGAGRFGVAGGRGQGAGAGNSSCLASVAGSIRRHMPAATSLGPGTVMVTFYVNSGGGISGISTSGGSAGHAALARRIVAASRGLATCAPAYAAQSITFR